MDQEELTRMNAYKTRFAEQLLRAPGAYLVAARQALYPAFRVGENINADNFIQKYAYEWANDPFVLDEMVRLVEEFGSDFFLPKKEDVVRAIYERAEREEDNESYVKLIKLASEIRGHIQKPGTIVEFNQNKFVQNVMEVPTLGTVEEWEASLEKQQAGLMQKASDVVN